MTGNELRKQFLDFFAAKQHLISPSAALIPENDPSLLLIGAGMAPLKPYFTGKLQPPSRRMASCQKCIRTGDIENVGRTARHHTFFEMLGNFSFGDYFKKEAIAWGWEFVTDVLKLPADRLWVSIHTEDDEAYAIWRDEIGVAEDRIVRLADNFWEIGTGPCGPCSEIYVDQGDEFACGNPQCGLGCDCDRYLEIWNLVFTQFDRGEDGTYTPLQQKNIDTGAGLERIAAVLQRKPSNYETDLVFPIIAATCNIAGCQYGEDNRRDVSLKVIADHLRSVVFMIGDGILPSNEGRGYVLRRLLRRAVRHGKLIGIDKPFLVQLTDVVVNMFAEHYSELAEKHAYINNIINIEEERFNKTLAQGLQLLKEEIDKVVAAGGDNMSGETVFKLYDTFGFPWELTQELLIEYGLTFQHEDFQKFMQEQRERARAARNDAADFAAVPDLASFLDQTIVYDSSVRETKVLAIFRGTEVLQQVAAGDSAAVILENIPFYAEGGGQVGDSGWLRTTSCIMRVDTTRKLPDGTPFLIGEVVEGYLQNGMTVGVELDDERNAAIARNHTATHLLHAALKQVLGEHVNQSGSLVNEERLRFDFSHWQAVTTAELTKIEDIVNQKIWAALPVEISNTAQDEAKQMGATALFGEKYGDIVRVVQVKGFSCELCGGSHVSNTSKIGVFHIISEESVAAGVRRIEAVTAQGVVETIRGQEQVLADVSKSLKASTREINERINGLLQRCKELEKEVAQQALTIAKGQLNKIIAEAEQVGDYRLVKQMVRVNSLDELRNMVDMVRDKLVSGAAIIGAGINGKENMLVALTSDLVKKGIKAGEIVKQAAQSNNGSGGGKPDMAQGGFKNKQDLQAAMQTASELIISKLR